MRRLRIGLALGLAAAVVSVAVVPSLLPGSGVVEAAFETPHAVAVEATPIPAFRPSEPELGRFGGLEFLGGLVLKSRDPAFGGLSGLRTLDHGRDLVAIGDEGSWFVARLRTEADGRLLGVETARLGPLLDERGRPFHGKAMRDAESLTIRTTEDGLEARVGFEHRHRVLSYRAGPRPADLLTAPGRGIPIPVEIGALPANSGLEAIADGPRGRPLVLLAEDPEPGETACPGWILDGAHGGRFRLATTDGFSATDAAFLPSGDLLVLQRRLTFFGAFAMRLVRIAAADLVPGATVAGEIVYTSRSGDLIDNMEGLAVDVAPDGTPIVTLVSDDNFFWLQSTVLLRFRLVGETVKRPAELTLR